MSLLMIEERIFLFDRWKQSFISFHFILKKKLYFMYIIKIRNSYLNTKKHYSNLIKTVNRYTCTVFIPIFPST